MRAVVYNGSIHDADNLPAHVDASQCVPEAEWYAKNAKVKGSSKPAPKPVKSEPAEKPSSDKGSKHGPVANA